PGAADRGSTLDRLQDHRGVSGGRQPVRAPPAREPRLRDGRHHQECRLQVWPLDGHRPGPALPVGFQEGEASLAPTGPYGSEKFGVPSAKVVGYTVLITSTACHCPTTDGARRFWPAFGWSGPANFTPPPLMLVYMGSST